jgi:hypothetical protein
MPQTRAALAISGLPNAYYTRTAEGLEEKSLLHCGEVRDPQC